MYSNNKSQLRLTKNIGEIFFFKSLIIGIFLFETVDTHWFVYPSLSRSLLYGISDLLIYFWSWGSKKHSMSIDGNINNGIHEIFIIPINR